MWALQCDTDVYLGQKNPYLNITFQRRLTLLISFKKAFIVFKCIVHFIVVIFCRLKHVHKLLDEYFCRSDAAVMPKSDELLKGNLHCNCFCFVRH